MVMMTRVVIMKMIMKMIMMMMMVMIMMIMMMTMVIRSGYRKFSLTLMNNSNKFLAQVYIS